MSLHQQTLSSRNNHSLGLCDALECLQLNFLSSVICAFGCRSAFEQNIQCRLTSPAGLLLAHREEFLENLSDFNFMTSTNSVCIIEATRFPTTKDRFDSAVKSLVTDISTIRHTHTIHTDRC